MHRSSALALTLALLTAALALPLGPGAALAPGLSACDAAAVRVTDLGLPLAPDQPLLVAGSRASIDNPQGTAGASSGINPDLLDIVHAGVLDTSCSTQAGSAVGEARVLDLVIDLNPLGVDLVIEADALLQWGASGAPSGNDGHVLGLFINGDGQEIDPAEPQLMNVGPVVIVLNDAKTPLACDERDGATLRVTLPGVVEVTAAHVLTRAC